jgi:hypothetical protein
MMQEFLTDAQRDQFLDDIGITCRKHGASFAFSGDYSAIVVRAFNEGEMKWFRDLFVAPPSQW